MAASIDWDVLLEKKYPSYKIEVNAFLDSLEIANSVEISTQAIYENIKNDRNVNENLKMLYKEALFGTNKEVKNCIKNRVGNFKRALKGHPKVKQMEMMHADDYSNTGMSQMKHTMARNKDKDLALAKSLQDAADRRKSKRTDIETSPSTKESDSAIPPKKKKTDNKTGKNDESDAADRNVAGPSGANTEKDDDQGTVSKPVVHDMIFSDGELEGIEENAPAGPLKTCGQKTGKGKKKLLPKKTQKLGPAKQTPATEIVDDAATDEVTKKNQMAEIAASFQASQNPQSKISKEEADILNEIKKCTQSVQKSSVEQTATMRAWNAKNGLDVAKYREEVQKKLQDESKADEDNKAPSGPIFPPPEDPDALVPLPNFCDTSGEEMFHGDDYLDDSTSSKMVPDESPFYANQEEDPEVAAQMFRDLFED